MSDPTQDLEPTFTLPDGCKSAQLALFAATVEDYVRIRDAHKTYGSERTRFHSDTGKPWTCCDWTEGDVYVALYAPANYRTVNL